MSLGHRLAAPFRRVGALLLEQLRQGITPEKLALTLALGVVLGLFPILGSTTILCGLAAVWLRLNHPLIQLLNYLCAPLQLLMLLPFYRAGEWLGAPHLALSIPELVQRFQNEGLLRFVGEFGVIALGGIGAWLLSAPAAAALLYLATLPLLRHLRRDRLRAPV